MDVNRTCIHGGSLVGTDGWLPREAAHHRWGERYPRPGCNTLVCARCGARVQQWPDLDVVRGAEVDVAGLFTQGPSIGLALKTIEVAAGARLYACTCTVHGERADRALQPPEGAEHAAKALPWSCAGHPPLALPATLDGEVVTREGLAPLVRRALAGTAPRDGVPWPRQAFEAELPAAWLAHLYALVPVGEARAMIGEAVASVLGDPAASAAERAGALDFHLFHPRASGAERIAPLLRDEPERFVGVALPWTKRRDLAGLAWKVLVERLHETPGPPDGVALALARAHVVAPGALGPVLLRVGHLDGAWLGAHAAEVARANPTLVPSLVDAMRRWSADDVTAAVHALMEAEGVDRAAVERAVRERLKRPR